MASFPFQSGLLRLTDSSWVSDLTLETRSFYSWRYCLLCSMVSEVKMHVVSFLGDWEGGWRSCHKQQVLCPVTKMGFQYPRISRPPLGTPCTSQEWNHLWLRSHLPPGDPKPVSKPRFPGGSCRGQKAPTLECWASCRMPGTLLVPMHRLPFSSRLREAPDFMMLPGDCRRSELGRSGRAWWQVQPRGHLWW